VPRTSALQLPSRRRCQLIPGVISETCRDLGAEMARHLPEAIASGVSVSPGGFIRKICWGKPVGALTDGKEGAHGWQCTDWSGPLRFALSYLASNW
jgi:hypothetical protein